MRLTPRKNLMTVTTETTTSTAPDAPEYGLPWVPDMDFAEKDPDVIQGEVLTDYQDAFKTLTGIAKTLGPGDPVRLFLLVVCYWLSQQRTIIDFTGKQNLLKYAREEYLDNLAALHGTRTLRLEAQPATTTLRFALTAALAFEVTIPSGTRCQGPNAIEFETLEDGVIPAGSLTVDVDAEATTVGELGNGFAIGQINSIINWNQPFGVTVTNTVATSGGSDEETDDQYRYRIWLAIESYSTCGPKDAYEFWALSAHPDIIQAVVHSAPEIAGEVWIYPLLKNGELPTQAILDAVEKECAEASRRPLTDYVTAKTAVAHEYSLHLHYYILTENDRLLDTIQANVQQAVTDWILWQRSKISRDINGDELAKRCLQAGAKRIEIITPNPSFQVLAYNELAVHTVDPAPIVDFIGFEDT